MTVEIMFVKEAINYALELFKFREKKSEQKTQIQQNFVAAFREALILTRSHLADIRDGLQERDRSKELKLSRAWNEVGLKGRDLEPQGDFYEVYFKKSDYWSDPNGWNLSNSDDIDISLKQAEDEATRFIQST